jgi:hypothetical protein
MSGLTPEEYRTAAKVLRIHDEPSSADHWDQVADSMEAEAAEDAYVLELAKHMAATAHPNMRWEEWTSGTPGSFQEGFITEARACLSKLEADGRLIPTGGDRTANAWDEGFEAGFSYAGNQSTPSGICPDPPLNPYVEVAEPEHWMEWEEVPEFVRFKSFTGAAYGSASVWYRKGSDVYSAIVGTAPVPTEYLNSLAPFTKAVQA